MSGEGLLQNDNRIAAGAGELSPCRRSGDRPPAGARPALAGGHLQTVRRAVAETFEAEGFVRFAEGVRAGRHDDAGRMRVGIAVAAALIREIFE